MNPKFFSLNIILLLMTTSCHQKKQVLPDNFFTVAAMKDVMWKGKLGPKIDLDTLTPSKGLYGLGPESYLTGEILIDNGTTYVSRVGQNNAMQVFKTNQTSAPFFVYSRVQGWDSISLPETIKNIKDLESYISGLSKNKIQPFAFKLQGAINEAVIHIQNLPKNTTVSSPKEAHQGQVDYKLMNEQATIVGVYSTNHQGVFTHHDSFLHMHLITNDKQKMGHLDAVNFREMMIYLPK